LRKVIAHDEFFFILPIEHILIFCLDDLVNGKGFSADYVEQPGQCGGAFTSSSGSITSPNYPGNYDSQQDCEWYIDVGEGM